MRNINKAIAIICLTAVMICIGYRIKVRADDIPTAPNYLQMHGVGDMTGIAYAYDNLTSDQKDIAAYLLGAFNHIYLMARGFSYSIPANETSWKAQFLALGNKVWQFATTAYGWKSRFNETFRQYLSSVCVYASGINTSFEAWYLQNAGSGELFIPYSEDAFSAWTEFYNDPSGDGIATLGYDILEWDSGDEYDFMGVGLSWLRAYDESAYNNFILNYSPVFFTAPVVTHSDGTQTQNIIGYDAERVIDTLYIQRSEVSYKFFRFGYSDLTLISSGTRFPTLYIEKYFISSDNVKIGLQSNSVSYVGPRFNVLEYTGSTVLQDLIDYAFNLTPFQLPFVNGVFAYGYYPYIEHVVLVDDLTTLSNPEEIFNTDGLNIIAPDPNREPYIIAPNGRLLFPSRPVGYDDPLDFWNNIVDNSLDDDGNSVTDEDFHQQIVNNTTINNYYVTNDDRINVPVEWFENDLTDQLANDSIPFLTFARDCIDTLGDLQIYLYGAIVFGLGGGILKKFLL